jgi:tetratricopeptide (TPR) repeat protein
MVRRGEVRGLPAIQKWILAGMLAAMAILVVIYSGRINVSIVEGYALRDFTMSERLLTQPRVLLLYISQLLLPLPSRFSVTHDIVTSTSLLSPVTTVFSIIIVFGLLVAAVLRVKKSPYFSFAILWFFVTMLVESTFLPLEMMFDHRMYLPCIFLIGAVVDFLLKRFYKDRASALVAVLCVVTLLFSSATYLRGKVWQNEITLWNDVLKKYPEYSRAYLNIATAYSDLEMYDLAEVNYKAAIKYENKLALPYYNLGANYLKQNKFEKALKAFNAGMKVNPNSDNIHFGLGELYYKKRDYISAEKHLKKGLKLSTRARGKAYQAALNNLGALYVSTGKYNEAIVTLRDLVKIFPRSGQIRFNLGQSLQGAEKYDEAYKEYLFAIENRYYTTKVFAEAVRCMLALNDINGAKDFYAKYSSILEKECIGKFINGMISEKANQRKMAKESYGSFIKCRKQNADSVLKGSDGYKEEAMRRLKQVSR